MTAPPDLRWRLADDDPQGALFDEVERHVGRGEFRGMEFLHVRARRIVNEVPKTSAVPFRYTINAYRGCTHACVYCLEGSTPVLMADGTTKPIADLEVGDRVYGSRVEGDYRRLVPSDVLAHWSTVKPAYRVTLDDGTALIASGDHRFLTDRGWKFVTGSQQGAIRRPHLTRNSRLLGTGGFATGPKGGEDYRRGYLCGMIRGDGHVGHYEYRRPGRTSGAVHRFRLALVDAEALERARQFLLDAGIVTREFVFQQESGGRKAMRGIRTQARDGVASIEAVVAWPAAPNDEWSKGFLAGIFDAEGCYSMGILRISNGDPLLVRRVGDALTAFGFRFTVEAPRPRMQVVRLLGGLREHLRFFHTVDPAITRKRTVTGRALKFRPALGVAAIEPLGIDLPLFDITTGTGDFVANGILSHNCFARPTHEYLGMDAGQDFERRIVVKINAVERLRAEVAPGRWAGDHIAMGTNTDPYQRCEGKYRLTRGIVGVLSEAANPFSILTKSTLVLSDLELLAEAARRTEVAVNLSIGTLNEEVWKATEPGTPHPLKRVEAVARLNQAGVPSGVLVAPVLPGLSDRPEQLEAVVKACVEAGARSISPILLHLRPGVREQYLGWLTDARPELVDEYRRLYPRAYAPRTTQQQLSRLVAQLVTRHGGRTASPGEARAVRPARRPAPSPPSRQLDLGI